VSYQFLRRFVNPFIRCSSKRVLAMACENLSNYNPIVMEFSGYLLLHENTSAIDFGPDRLISLAGQAPNGGTDMEVLACFRPCFLYHHA